MPAVAALITAGLFMDLAPSGQCCLFRSLSTRAIPLVCFGTPRSAGYASSNAAVLSEYEHSFPEFGLWSEQPVMVAVLGLFSVGEELGWRGFFLANLMKGKSLLAATGWMALFWGLWHLPFYLAANSEGQSTWLQYLLFLGGIFPVSAFFALIYSRTRSVLCILFRGSLNAGAAHWFGRLPVGQLLPYPLWIILLWIAAMPMFRAVIIISRQQIASER